MLLPLIKQLQFSWVFILQPLCLSVLCLSLQAQNRQTEMLQNKRPTKLLTQSC